MSQFVQHMSIILFSVCIHSLVFMDIYLCVCVSPENRQV